MTKIFFFVAIGSVGALLGYMSPWPINHIGYWGVTMPLCILFGSLAYHICFGATR